VEIPATQRTLLQRLRDPADEAAWQLFEARYRDLVVRFARSRGQQQADAEDIAQTVLTSLFALFRAPGKPFEYDPQRGRFRDYLFRCVRNAITRHAIRQKSLAGAGVARPSEPADGLLTEIAAPDSNEASSWENEWMDHHYRLALATVRLTFEPVSVEAFERCLRGDSIRDIADSMAMTEQGVHKIKQRIRDRMQALIAEQIRDEDAE